PEPASAAAEESPEETGDQNYPQSCCGFHPGKIPDILIEVSAGGGQNPGLYSNGCRKARQRKVSGYSAYRKNGQCAQRFLPFWRTVRKCSSREVSWNTSFRFLMTLL